MPLYPELTLLFVPCHEVGELRNAAVRLSVCPSVRHTLVNTIFRKQLH